MTKIQTDTATMINWYNEVSRSLDKIPNCVAYFDAELQEAKKQCKIACDFSVVRVFFPNPRKPNSMHRRSVLSSFYFFSFCVFLPKMTKKPAKKTYRKKRPKIKPGGDPRPSKMAPGTYFLKPNAYAWSQNYL